ncbi:hypothetical protein SH661x_002709 [Planctomicrobium sp. SH661]|uniref:hypothetical protein n=1 Tax=Planctomicrobium sp. SH661 TaxID=3448124 RepID=UPI003F5C7271
MTHRQFDEIKIPVHHSQRIQVNMKNVQKFNLVTALFAVTLVLGCGRSTPVEKTGTVSGSIRFGDQPMDNVAVIFENPTEGVSGSAVVKDGTFQIRNPLIVGDYVVTVQPVRPPPGAAAPSAAPTKVPQHYQDAAVTNLRAQVLEGENTVDLVLKR